MIINSCSTDSSHSCRNLLSYNQIPSGDILANFAPEGDTINLLSSTTYVNGFVPDGLSSFIDILSDRLFYVKLGMAWSIGFFPSVGLRVGFLSLCGVLLILSSSWPISLALFCSKNGWLSLDPITPLCSF